MTISLPRLSRVGALSVALAWTLAAFTAVLTPTPAEARSSKVFYTAELVQPTEESRAIAGGVAWSCKGTTCVAAKGNSRPMRVCRELQREVGSVATFTAKGKALAEDKLAKCNG